MSDNPWLQACPLGKCGHSAMWHDWEDHGERPVCCADGCPCGKGPTTKTSRSAEVTESPGLGLPDCKQTSEVKT